MNILKKSFLVAMALLWGMQTTWGMEDLPDKKSPPLLPSLVEDKDLLESNTPKSVPDNLEKERVIKLTVEADPSPDYKKEAQERYEGWKGRYQQTKKLTPDVNTLPQDFDQTFSKLKANEKPLTHRGEVYLGSSSHKRVAAPTDRVDVAYVGPDHMNYLQREDNLLPTYEAFAVPQPKDPKIDDGSYSRRHQPKFIEVYSLTEAKMIVDKMRDKRKLSPADIDIIFDPGHGIDHAITLTHNDSNSTAEVRNYTPQNAYYNRFIRNPLVQDEEYKEIAIYPEYPLVITRQKGKSVENLPIPEGFILFLLDRNTGDIKNSYYFPNFYHYMQDVANIPQDQTAWKFFANKYKIKNEVAKVIWGNNEISDEQARRDAQRLSEHVGYRALSGRFEVIPERGWDPATKNALVRTAAIYRIEKAAEYDATTENMLQVAQIFNNADFTYSEFEGTLHVPHLARYWVERALKEAERKDYPAQDVSFFMFYDQHIPITLEEMNNLISSYEERLAAQPNTEHIAELLGYFDEHHNEDKYRQWSAQISELVRSHRVPDSIVIHDKNQDQLIDALSNTTILNIILDFEITLDNLKGIIEGFKQRAIHEMEPYEQTLTFLEISNISSEALDQIFQAFEQGIEYKGDWLCVDVRRTAIKLPLYNRPAFQEYMGKNYPKTHVRILN
ncbi:MAG: hypothetical protein K2P93_05080 [Alphaproteobacteria bacterium]|nr:hypothetical protein [Alphaproteobacteria bacterium]